MADGGLKAIFLEQRPMLLRLLTARLGSIDEAEDALQDMWMRLDRLIDQPVSHPAAFLCRIAVNLATDRRIARSRRGARDAAWIAVQPEADEMPDAERAAIARDAIEAVESTIAEMPDRMRIALRMFRFEDRSQRDIAQTLGISVSGVEKLLQRAYRQIHDRLEPIGEDHVLGHRLLGEGVWIVQSSDSAILAQAIRWHLRQTTMSVGDWEAFTAWLETSPAHADAYDRIAVMDRLVGDARLPPEAANDREPLTYRWRWAMGGVAAAVLVAVSVTPWMMPAKSTRYEVATRLGEQRTIQLADGTQIEMNGGTRVRLDRANPRLAELEQGEATLHVRHDAANPFVVTSGGLTIQDAGTVFNLARADGKVSVEVSEGSVVFEPAHASVTLKAGDGLVAREQGGSVTRFKVSPDMVGGWRTGVLSFDGETVAAVFDSIHRRYGTDVVLEGDLPHQPFTGMVRLTGVADRDIPHLATMIGTGWRRDGQRWILSAGPR